MTHPVLHGKLDWIASLEPLQTGTAYGWLVTDGNSRKDQIAAGRDYARLNLTTTEMGIAIHPNSQALQEYEEMKELYKTIHDELGVDTCRGGYKCLYEWAMEKPNYHRRNGPWKVEFERRDNITSVDKPVIEPDIIDIFPVF